MEQQELHNTKPAGLTRILLACLYDWMLVLAIMMVASVPMVAPSNEAINPGNPFYRMLLVVIAAVYFAGFWSMRGQTLGMRAWRLTIKTPTGKPVSFTRALLRFACACLSAAAFGIGYLWMLASPDGLSWHDRLSETRLKLLPKKEAR